MNSRPLQPSLETHREAPRFAMVKKAGAGAKFSAAAAFCVPLSSPSSDVAWM